MVNEMTITGAVIVFIIIIMSGIKGKIKKDMIIKIFGHSIEFRQFLIYIPYLLAVIPAILINMNFGSGRQFIQDISTSIFIIGAGATSSYDLVIEKIKKYLTWMNDGK